MGLDVYLVRYEDKAAADVISAAYQDRSDAIWNAVCGSRKYEALSEAEKDAARERIAALRIELGCDDCGEPPAPSYKRFDEQPSAKYPDHYFKVGYFRSSYNGSGINRVLGDLLGIEGLYWIFDRERSDEYEFQPDWAQVRQRAKEARRLLSDRIETDGGLLKAFTLHADIGTPLKSTAEAVAMIRKELAERKSRLSADPAREKTWGGSFSRGGGEYFLDEPMKIVGILPCNDVFNRRNVAVIFLEDDDGWYVQALEIVEETCDFVLAREDANKFWLRWSS